jgi:TolB protein
MVATIYTLPTILVLSVLFIGSAWADHAENTADDDTTLEVVVSPGAKALEPMAVPETRCADAPRAVCRQLTKLIRRNMLLSFFVRVQPPRSYLADPETETLQAPSWQDWANIGARYLIKAEVRGPAPYRVEARLFSVPNKAEIRIQQAIFTEVKDRGLRKTAHAFSNSVIEALTGVPGVYGTRIAYAARVAPGVKSIGVVDMDGARRGALVSNGSINMLPSWGLGGVLYTSFKQGKPDIYFGKRKLSRDAGHYRKVAASRDGSRIIASISYGGQSDLFLIGKDGKVLKNLTRTGADELSPTFSPDGSKIAFVSNAAGGPQIYMMSSGGGAQTRLTHAGDYNYAPDWGPNGLIAFSGMDAGVSDVFTVTEGGTINRLTQNQGSNRYPSWSGNGRYLAFASSRPKGRGIWLMSADGRYQYRIASGGAPSNLAWQR